MTHFNHQTVVSSASLRKRTLRPTVGCLRGRTTKSIFQGRGAVWSTGIRNHCRGLRWRCWRSLITEKLTCGRAARDVEGTLWGAGGGAGKTLATAQGRRPFAFQMVRIHPLAGMWERSHDELHGREMIAELSDTSHGRWSGCPSALDKALDGFPGESRASGRPPRRPS